MDFVREDMVYRARQETKHTETGSGTPCYNINLTKMRTVGRFLKEEISIPCEVFKSYLLDTISTIANEKSLRTRQDERSRYKGVSIEWENPECE